MSPRHELTTKDGVPLDDLLDQTRRLVDIFNDAERPFREMFAEDVDQQTFYQEPADADVTWEELGEGEAPRTLVSEQDGKQLTVRIKKYGKSLGFTQEFIEDHTEDRVLRKVRTMLEGAQQTEQNLIRTALENGIADGSGVWYDIPDYGDYTFSNGHDHWFEDTDNLFDNDGADDTDYEAHEHIEEAKRQLTHHGFDGPFVALVSNGFKRSLRDEISWDASYHVPMATGMRSSALEDLDIVIDGVRLIESPWLSGDKFYVTQAQNQSPVKFYERRPVQVTQPNGGVVRHPGELVGASGSARFGVKNVDPLRAVYVNATSLK